MYALANGFLGLIRAQIPWGPQTSDLPFGKVESEATQGHGRLHVVTACYMGLQEVIRSRVESQVFLEDTGSYGFHVYLSICGT